MGKAGDAEQAEAAAPRTAPATAATVRRCAAAAAGEVLCAKGVVALVLSVGVFLSAFFLLLHVRASGLSPDYPGTLVGEIQASFILLKPSTEIASHTRMLEDEIYREIGVPNSKVSVSMETILLEDFTYVKFGIAPDPINTAISAESMRALRKTLIRLTLQQLNLSLTPSVFGDSFCLEMLGFPGGISMELPQYNFAVNAVDPIMNFTVDRSIHQIRVYIEEMKKDLESTLELPPDKGIYVNLTNKNGSTVTPPVTVQVYISFNDYSTYEKLGRLKQLAEIITESNSSNLGLNPIVFGRIKGLNLAPNLQIFVPSFVPSSSPTPISSHSLHVQPNTTNIREHCSYHDLMKNTTIPSRKLIQLHGGNTSRDKNNYTAVAAPIFIAQPPEP